jgi:tRNA(Ile)-lysidine synthase
VRLGLGDPDGTAATPWAAVAAEVARELEDRLTRDDDAPLLVALSGGGDSVALLLAALAWSRQAGRRIVAATVDHRLAARSADWAETCRRRCEGLGLPHITLVWEGPRPTAGLVAAARAARHRLLAGAARSLGARVILMGHTADDVIEAALMREAGATTPGPRGWAPSPVWPDGRDVFLMRPLLRLRRAMLRRGLVALGERWIEDPANADPASLRVAARAMAAEGRQPPAACSRGAGPSPFQVGDAGELWTDTRAFVAAPDDAARAWLGTALLCASGQDRPARSRGLDRIIAALRSDRPLAATLAGARLSADGARLVIAREVADARAGRPREMTIRAGETGVWDGRYQIRAGRQDLTVAPLVGRLARLPRDQRRRVRGLHPLARPALPVFVSADGTVSCPTLGDGPLAGVECLVKARLAAACGEVDHESAIVSWRTWEPHPKSVGMSRKRPADEPS